ncbi:Multiple antibiotic resistance protein MarR [Microbacterium lemovicicum]|uniref:Multiple antibiotic resistance protein MarR n=1 Tax=Microbacterium lemovicicum TaxID=1072463 RepID=A0A3S9WB23_9MICO|nr:MarR family transcriptional regulator [Microbacterium lemovicicum]AZS37257.1 Multiple antibiotic resistance protein MarR [Microbacterium lemovicicum]
MAAHADRDDEVDLLIDAWSRRLPEADLSPLDVMSRLRRVSLRLARLRSDAFRAAGLAAWEFDVLAALGRAEPVHELNPAQLIERTMISSGAMTNRLGHLAERGLIERAPNPQDGRSVLVRLTPAGAERVDAAMTELVRREELELQPLRRQDRDELVRLLRLLGEGSRGL